MAPIERNESIEIDYDSIADVLYISLATEDDFAMAENVDDMVFVMRGQTTGAILGFEVLNAKRHGAKEIRAALLPLIQAEKNRIQGTMLELQSRLEELERRSLESLVPV